MGGSKNTLRPDALQGPFVLFESCDDEALFFTAIDEILEGIFLKGRFPTTGMLLQFEPVRALESHIENRVDLLCEIQHR